ncbi:MAG: hypothetical protein KGH88_00020 [Thaumarchaeota archaeon]|nr:hypothetical protein [Nitrososphaerota archaeon]
MIHKVRVDLSKIKNMTLELDDAIAPKTVRSFLSCLPLGVGINVWGEELYTDKTPMDVGAENSNPVVDLMDVAYWPPGRAICLFFGPTPIGTKGEIKPYSPVNVMGKIQKTEKDFIKNIRDGTRMTFALE